MIPSPPDAPESRDARAPILLLSGIALLYLALSPWRIADRGYNGQDIRAADESMRAVSGFLAGRGWNPPTTWSRHGVLGFASLLPFVASSRAFFGSSPEALDRVTSLEPLLETIAILLLLVVWSRRLGTTRRALAIAIGAAFTTMLWPYAYIGLETTQSLALLAAGYLALASPPPYSLPRTIAFVIAAILAVCAKSTGIFLVPAVAFLAIEFFRVGAKERSGKARLGVLGVAIGSALVFAANAWTREFFWRRFGGSWPNLRHSFVHDPFLFLVHGVSLVASPNKGLVFYAPLAVLGLFRLRRVIAERPRTGIFVALTFGGLVAGFSFLKIWADETWGPRYLHTAVAPLLLCLAVPGIDAGRGPRRLLAGFAAMLGGAVSLLGVLFVYGGPYDAAKAAGQNTLEAIQGDVVWNPIRFALRLLVVALHPARPHVWVASHYWWFAKPPGSAPEPEIDLSKYAHFQSAVVAAGQPPGVRVLLAVCGLGGLLLVGLALREVRRGGVSRAARLAFPIGGVLLLTILVGAWAAAAQRTLRGEFHQQAPEILVTPELEADARRVAAFAGNENVMLCITRRPGSMTFFVWRRLLYPLRLVPLLPEGIGTGEMDALRERWRARYVLSLGQGSAPIAPGLRRTSWIAPDVLVGEIGDP